MVSARLCYTSWRHVFNTFCFCWTALILDERWPGRAGPSWAGPGHTGPSRAEPSRAMPSWAGPSRAEPSRAGPGQNFWLLLEQIVLCPSPSQQCWNNSYFCIITSDVILWLLLCSGSRSNSSSMMFTASSSLLVFVISNPGLRVVSFTTSPAVSWPNVSV